jgi:hypothetical protein
VEVRRDKFMSGRHAVGSRHPMGKLELKKGRGGRRETGR